MTEGIAPGPEYMETLLDAFEATAHTQDSYYQSWTQRFPEGSTYHRRSRQFHAFRARILARDAEKDVTIDALTIHIGRLQRGEK